MKYKTLLGAISLALTLNSAYAGGIYRYHSKHAEALSSRRQAKYDNQIINAKLRHEQFKQKKQLEAMRKRYKQTKAYRRAMTTLRTSKANYEATDLELLSAERKLWDSGINTDMVHRPDLNPGEYTNIRRMK